MEVLDWSRVTADVVLWFTFVLVMKWLLMSFSNENKALLRAVDANTAALLSLHHHMLVHELTVTGVNEVFTEMPNEERIKHMERRLKDYEEGLFAVQSILTSRAAAASSTSGPLKWMNQG